ncbi:hypothetical protein BLNAU_4804 [Blattamonas nauphoetae]|uniref:Ig-like domain-containing protein n=1 Tax=Blattamonas nauphoetae TaxID=2049346 RepID=A0ABQ9Y904_9EUKA|nr:hypothetical protein BLNAU_4804 [Blattamonas nauphoetae]
MTALNTKIKASTDSPCADCSAFLNWSEEEEEQETVPEKAVVFLSLVATVKLQPAVNDSLEAKAVKFLESVDRDNEESADVFLARLTITTATMGMLQNLIEWCSAKINHTLVKADLIPQLVITLNPLSLSFAEAVDLHINIMKIIRTTVWLATPRALTYLEIEDDIEQQAVHETVLKQVLAPSEKYICHLCVNRFSIIDGEQSKCFLTLLAQLLRICNDSASPPVSLSRHQTLPLLPTQTRPSSPFLAKRSHVDDGLGRFGETEEPKCFFMQISHFLITLLSTRDAEPTFLTTVVHHPCPVQCCGLSPLTTLNHLTPLCLSLTTHTLPLPSASPSPPTPSHSPLPLPHHPHPPTPLCLSLTTHTLPLPSASPSPPTPSHSPLPLPHHPHPPTPLCLSLTTHTLPLPSASPSPPTPSHSPLPLPHHPHPPTPLCLSLTTHTLPLPSASPSPHPISADLRPFDCVSVLPPQLLCSLDVVFGTETKPNPTGTAVVSSGPNGVLPATEHSPLNSSLCSALLPPPTVLNLMQEHSPLNSSLCSALLPPPTVLNCVYSLSAANTRRLEWNIEDEVTSVVRTQSEDVAISTAGTIKITTPKEPIRIEGADCSIGGEKEKAGVVEFWGVGLSSGKGYTLKVQKEEGGVGTGNVIELEGIFSSESEAGSRFHSEAIFKTSPPCLSFVETDLVHWIVVEGGVGE